MTKTKVAPFYLGHSVDCERFEVADMTFSVSQGR